MGWQNQGGWRDDGWARPAATGGGAYQGPGDIVSGAICWYGLRAYNALQATAAVKAVTLRDVTASTNIDLFVQASGDLNLTPLAGITGHTFHVSTLYDQTGNGNDVTQATDANRPIFTVSGLNGKPVMTFVNPIQAVNQWLLSGTTFVMSAPFTISAVYNSNIANQTFLFQYDNIKVQGTGTVNKCLMFDVADSTFIVCNGSTDGHTHAGQFIYNGSGAQSDIDGNITTGTVTGNLTRLGFNIFFSSTANSQSFDGFITEAGFWNATFKNISGVDQNANMITNQTNYWGPF